MVPVPSRGKVVGSNQWVDCYELDLSHLGVPTEPGCPQPASAGQARVGKQEL